MATAPDQPGDVGREPLPAHAVATIGRLVPTAFGVATGTLAALALFGITIVPALDGDPHLTEHVGLLSQYFYGYRVTPGGAVLAAGYGFLIGYIFGDLFARLRNVGMTLYLRFLLRRAEHDAASDLLDHL